MPIAVATDPSALTPSWITSAFAEGGRPDWVAIEVSAERIGEGVGFMGELHRLSLTYADAPDDAPASIIAKIPTNDPGGRMVGTMMRLYEKESGFYRHLQAECPAPTAACFYNGAEPDDGNYCLLLEDLRTMTPGDQLTPRTLDEQRADLSLLAKVHGPWSDGRSDEHQWLPTLDDVSTAAMLAMVPDATPVALERFGHLIPEHMHSWGARFATFGMEWVADFCKQPSTILHGDYRTDNFMFGADGSRALIDWQVMSRAPGTYDLYYYLALSADPEVVKANFDDLVDHYLTELRATGASAPTAEIVLDQMRGIGLLLFALGAVSLSQLDPANPRGEALFLSMYKRGVSLAEFIDLEPALR